MQQLLTITPMLTSAASISAPSLQTSSYPFLKDGKQRQIMHWPFYTLAAQTKWVEDTLKLIFLRGLNPELQTKLACRDEGNFEWAHWTDSYQSFNAEQKKSASCLQLLVKIPVQTFSVIPSQPVDHVPLEYVDLAEAFSKQKATQLHLYRSSDCAINLIPGSISSLTTQIRGHERIYRRGTG